MIRAVNGTEDPGTVETDVDGPSVIRKCYRGLTPWLWLMAFFTYLDRSNLSFAAFQFKADLHFSNSTYGLGASMFFVGYLVGQIPSNIIMRYVESGWLTFLIISWGLVSAMGSLLHSTRGFLVQRLILGLVEAGTFPGIVVLLTEFFISRELQRAISFNLTSIPISQVLGAPIGAGLILMDGLRNMHGWRWLFLIEGLITVLFGIAFHYGLARMPMEAYFLTAPERAWLTERQAHEREVRGAQSASSGNMWATFKNWRVYWVGFGWLLEEAVKYGIVFWTPLILDGMLIGRFNGRVITGQHGSLKDAAFYSAKLALISSILFFAATIAIVATAYSSSHFQERNYHIAGCLTVSGVAFICIPTALRHSGCVAAYGVLVIAGAFSFAIGGPATSWIPDIVHGPAVNTGIAIFNSMGTAGGIIGPCLIGVLSDRYSYAVAMSTLGAFNLAAALVFLACPGASKEVRAALVEAERFDQEGEGRVLPAKESSQHECMPGQQERKEESV